MNKVNKKDAHYRDILEKWFNDDETVCDTTVDDGICILGYKYHGETSMALSAGKTFKEIFEKLAKDPILEYLAEDMEGQTYFSDEEMKVLKKDYKEELEHYKRKI